jgi:hypothetical protein
LNSKGFRRIYPREILERYEERNHCPANDQLCEEGVWFTQTMFLGTHTDMDQIAEAIRKVQSHAPELARA